MKLTIVYVTGRQDPRVDWMCDDLALQQKSDDDFQLVVVDTYGRSTADLGVREALFRSGVVTTRPKPNVWQGPHRVTTTDWWANSNSRNTGIVLAKHDYVAFLDDRCHLGGHWLDTVRRGELTRASVLAGAYEKQENGRLTQDHRLHECPGGKDNCGGGWLYGCTLALPLEWCLEANGFEEGCDGLSGEDYIFGFQLENNGHRIDYVPTLFVALERSQPHVNTYLRRDKGPSPNDKSHAAIARFKPRKRTEFTEDLRQLRDRLAAGGTFSIPDPKADYRDWFDGALIRDER